MSKDHTKKPDPDEHNCYRDTLHGCDVTLLPGCKDDVCAKAGNPAQAVATSIQNGGWECTEADGWVKELLAHTKDVPTAFDDAQSAVHKAWAAEPETVPAHDYRGLSWPRMWHIQRHNI